MSNFDDNFIRDLRKQFAQDAVGTLDEIEGNLLSLEKAFSDPILNELRRNLHTLKGNSKAVGFDDFSALVHNFESVCTAELLPKRISEALSLRDLLTVAIQDYLSTSDSSVFSKLPRTF